MNIIDDLLSYIELRIEVTKSMIKIFPKKERFYLGYLSRMNSIKYDVKNSLCKKELMNKINIGAGVVAKSVRVTIYDISDNIFDPVKGDINAHRDFISYFYELEKEYQNDKKMPRDV